MIVVAVISSVILKEVGAADGAGGNIMYVYKYMLKFHYGGYNTFYMQGTLSKALDIIKIQILVTINIKYS